MRLLARALCIAIAVAAPPALSQPANLAASGLISEPEGATIVTDRAQWPTRFSEAPMLAERVRAGPPIRWCSSR
jgi:hypothetical protein